MRGGLVSWLVASTREFLTEGVFAHQMSLINQKHLLPTLLLLSFAGIYSTPYWLPLLLNWLLKLLNWLPLLLNWLLKLLNWLPLLLNWLLKLAIMSLNYTYETAANYLTEIFRFIIKLATAPFIASYSSYIALRRHLEESALHSFLSLIKFCGDTLLLIKRTVILPAFDVTQPLATFSWNPLNRWAEYITNTRMDISSAFDYFNATFSKFAAERNLDSALRMYDQLHDKLPRVLPEADDIHHLLSSIPVELQFYRNLTEVLLGVVAETLSRVARDA
jgi:hypothetical protein